MTNCTAKPICFSSLNRKKVEANFTGGNIGSDGGILLLGELDKKLQLTERLRKVIKDDRHPAYIEHTIKAMLRQRVYAIAAGYEDINDHDELRHDLCFQRAIGREVNLASSST